MSISAPRLGRYLSRITLGGIAGAFLFGCSSYPDVNSDLAKNNKATFQRDALDCAKSYPETSSGAHVKQRISCMNLKGWR
jgi:hypothetical protein